MVSWSSGVDFAGRGTTQACLNTLITPFQMEIHKQAYHYVHVFFLSFLEGKKERHDIRQVTRIVRHTFLFLNVVVCRIRIKYVQCYFIYQQWLTYEVLNLRVTILFIFLCVIFFRQTVNQVFKSRLLCLLIMIEC